MRKGKIILLACYCFFISAGGLLFAESVSQDDPVPPNVQVLLGKLFSPRERARMNAALKLGDYSHPLVIDNLIHVVAEDSSETVRRVAIRSLGNTSSPAAFKTILKAVESESIGIKMEAMGAAVNFSTPAVRGILLAEAASPNPMVRQKAVAYLGKLKQNNELVINKLVESLDDISEGVRVAACRVLAGKKYEVSLDKLVSVLSDDRSDIVRENAAAAVTNIGGKKAENSLNAALEDGSPSVRIKAAEGLALMGSKSGLNEAIQGIKSSDARVRIAACNIIGLTGGRKNRIFLEQALGDYDRRVQRAAMEALKKLDERVGG